MLVRAEESAIQDAVVGGHSRHQAAFPSLRPVLPCAVDRECPDRLQDRYALLGSVNLATGLGLAENRGLDALTPTREGDRRVRARCDRHASIQR